MPSDPAYQREYQLSKYHRWRQEALELLGGECVQCGSQDLLEFDHIDPAKKSFDLSKYRCTRALWFAEVAKCQLLCKSCHKRKTSSEQRVDVHGTWGMVRNRGCKCDVCREFRNAYSREYKRRRKQAVIV